MVTADLPLADRCLKAGARVVTHDGEVLSVANIGPRLATRDLMADLRASNPFMQGGGAGFSKADRSRFLQVLEGAAQDLDRLMTRLAGDPRHDEVVVIERKPIPARGFSGYSAARCFVR